MEADDPDFTSRDLKFDKNLKVNFFQVPDAFHEIDTSGPYFPNPLTLGTFARAAYKNAEEIEVNFLKDGWQLLAAGHNDKRENGYFGAAFWNPTTHQVVISHRGTKFALGSILTDFKSVVLNLITEQLLSSMTFVEEVLKTISNFKVSDGTPPQVSITGHSLGGWLAQVTALTGEYLESENDHFVKRKSSSFHMHTVVFESPGCEHMLLKLKRIIDDLEERYKEGKIDLSSLDITHYMSVPNIINTYGRHIGRIYQLNTADNLDDKSGLFEITKKYHGSKIMLECLESMKLYSPAQVIDWPVSKTLPSKELKKVLKELKKQKSFDFSSTLRYKQRQVSEGKIYCPLNVFTQKEKEFLIFFKEILNSGIEILIFKLQGERKVNECKSLLHEYDIVSGTNYVKCTSEENMNNLIRKTKALCRSEDLQDTVREQYSYLNVGNELYLKYLSDSVISEIREISVVFRDTVNLGEFLKSTVQSIMLLKARQNAVSLTLLKIQGVLAGLEKNKDTAIPGLTPYFVKVKDLKEILSFVNFKHLIYGNRCSLKLIIVLCSVDNMDDIIQQLLLKHNLAFVKFIFLLFNDSNLAISNPKVVCETYEDLKSEDLGPSDREIIINCDLFKLGRCDLTFSMIKLVEKKTDLQTPAVQKLLSDLINCFEFWSNIIRSTTITLPVFKPAFRQGSFAVAIGKLLTGLDIISLLKKHNQATFTISGNEKREILQKKAEEIFKQDLRLRGHFEISYEFLQSERLVYIMPKEIIHDESMPSLQEETSTVFRMYLRQNSFYLAEAFSSGMYIKRHYKEKYILKKEALNDEHLSKTEIFIVISPVGYVSEDNAEHIKVFNSENSAKKEFYEICKSSECQKKNIHLFSEENENGEATLVWKSSYRSADNIRQFVTLESKSLSEEELLCRESRITVITGEPGSGKSLALFKIMSLQKDKWCVYKTLKEIREGIKNICEGTKIEDIANIFLSVPFTEDSMVHLLFKFCLQNDSAIPVCLLLDGFDEITEEDQKNTIKLIEYLRVNTKAVVYVTSRKNVCHRLEKSLCIFPAELESVGIEDQRKFLNRYWNLQHVCPSERCNIAGFTEMTVRQLADVIHDSATFLGIPLQLRMLAETISPDCKNSNAQIPIKNISDLFDGFIRKKYSIYFTEKKSLGDLPAAIQKATEDQAEKYHQVVAHEELFGEGAANPPDCKTEEFEELGNEIGMVQNGKFIHRTFAEYFFVRQIRGLLENPNMTPEMRGSLFDYFFKNLFQGCMFRTVRIFLNNVYEDNVPFSYLLSLFKSILKPYEGFENDLRNCLLILVEENQHVLLSSVLSGISKPYTYLLENYHNESKVSSSKGGLLHVAANSGSCKSLEILIAFLRVGELNLEEDTQGEVEHFSMIYRNNVNFRDEELSTPLHRAASNGHVDCVKVLIANDGEVNARNKNENTPLHSAATKGYVDCMKLLIKNGALFDAKNKNGETPLHNAAYNGYKEGVKILIQSEAEVDSLDKTGNTPLHYAALNGYLDCIELLLGNDANCDVKNKSGATPLHNAALSGSSNCVEILILYGAKVDVRNNSEMTPLHAAANKGSDKSVEILLKHGAKVDSCNSGGETPLHKAVRNKSSKCAEMLVKKGADVNVFDRHKYSPLHYAAGHGSLECVELLVLNGGNVNSKNDKNETPLHRAVSKGEAQCAGILLEHGSDPDAQDVKGRTPLHKTAKKWKIDCAKLLLEHGAKINAKNKFGRTLLHDAWGEDSVFVKFLIENGADVNARDGDGNTPLHVYIDDEDAEELDCSQCLRVLIHEGAVIDALNNIDNTPLHAAAISGDVEYMEILLEAGANIRAKNKKGESPLHLAARNFSDECVKFLLEKGADVDDRGNTEKTPLHEAAKEGDEDCVEILLEYHAEVYARDEDAMTPLHVAAEEGHANVVKMLLQYGADLNARNRKGWTPLHCAANEDNFDCIKVLLEKGAAVSVRDNNGKTPRQLADSDEDCVELLQEYGGEI